MVSRYRPDSPVGECIRLAGVLLDAQGMTTQGDIHRREALCELVRMRDPFDAQRRHRVVCEGRPDRHAQIPRLAAIHIQTRMIELGDRAALREDIPATTETARAVNAPLMTLMGAWRYATLLARPLVQR